MSDYAVSTALVSADWAQQHLDDPGVRFVEVDVDTEAYAQGHIPGAVAWNWETQLLDDIRRDIVGREEFSELLSSSGIGPDTHVVLYGDNNNWFAAWAYWQLKAHGFARVSLLDGGRGYWRARGLPGDSANPSFGPTGIELPAFDGTTRMLFSELRSRLDDPRLSILDVRTPEEYSGAVTAPEGYPAIAQRAGHVPGAVRAPWEDVLAEDGRFRPVDELRARYTSLGLDHEREVTMYCGVGVRSSHTWFVLHELLGFARARNYDGSWAEWGSAIGAPIESPAREGAVATA